MPIATFAPFQRASGVLPPSLAGAASLGDGATDNVFWCDGIGNGAAAIVQLCAPIDSMSTRIGQLPVRPALTRPVVGQYLSMLKTLAAAWGTRTRPALLLAMAGLGHFGDSVGQSWTIEALAGRRADNGRAAVRVLDALLRRLAAPLAAFGNLNTDFGSYLSQMAAASGELEADTELVTQRLETDGVHAFLLSQQASTLQSKLDEETARADAWWLLGPHAEPLRHDISLHAAALEGVRRQLDNLRAEQAATRAEADYLQSLLPTLSTYLSAVDRMGAAIEAVHAGLVRLQHDLLPLKAQMATAPASAGDAELDISAALPRWRALSAGAAGLKRPTG